MQSDSICANANHTTFEQEKDQAMAEQLASGYANMISGQI